MNAKIDSNERAQKIVSDYEGIYPVYTAFYAEAVFYAASRAQEAFGRFSQHVSSRGSASDIVATVHEALGHSSALSRFFFPADTKPLARARAAKLRQVFNVDNSSALLNRDLRNALEHFDERLDAYLLGDIVGYVFPGPLTDNAALADDTCGHIFRLVDPETETFVLLGRRHRFGAVRCEVARIAELAEGLR